MNLTKARLREIIQEELATISLAEQGEGGDKAAQEPMEKDAEKLATKLDTGALDAVFDKISDIDEFEDTMRLLINKASQHPSIKSNHVRRVLLALAKEASEAK